MSDEFEDFDEEDEAKQLWYEGIASAETFGCELGRDCIMPGLHFPSECHTSEMLEVVYAEMEKD